MVSNIDTIHGIMEDINRCISFTGLLYYIMGTCNSIM